MRHGWPPKACSDQLKSAPMHGTFSMQTEDKSTASKKPSERKSNTELLLMKHLR